MKIAEAKRMNANAKATPESSLGPVDEADIDIAPDVAPIGNQYIKSMAKFITAWISAWGRWSPYFRTDWML